MNICNFEIGTGRAFIIAEIGNNHNGCFDRAIELVDLAKNAGADCAKFQMRHLEQLYRLSSLEKGGDDLGTEYILDLLKRFELSVDQHKRISNYCKEQGILYLCTPWDMPSADALDEFSVPAYKVASADLTNLPLLDKLSQKKRPLIISTGMSTIEEVEITVDFLNKRNAEYILLHCNSTYPAPLHDINLKWMQSLKEIHSYIGYSGHERGIYVSIGAAALGACVIERHLTTDRMLEGPDHAASLTGEEFSMMVRGIRDVEESLGSGSCRQLSQGEMINRENLGKSLVAARPLIIGSTVTIDDIKIRSPGQGLSPQYYEMLLGRRLNRDVAEEDFFYHTDLTDFRIEPRQYSFKRPWGIPVRYHDFMEYQERIKPNIWEFHLSYSDMNLSPFDYLRFDHDTDFIVHAPELFSNSQLMDLASIDDEYRLNSVRETQRVINITRSLKEFFPKTKRPLIVANVGGFSMDSPLPESIKNKCYEQFGRSLNELDLAGVELIPQTMAPFPWHFGGQRYQNLFMKIDDIIKWCEIFNLRMCFDVSHSSLMCNHFGYDLYDFTKKISQYTAHLHIGDAKGVNGEGLQIGDGNIDFELLGNLLELGCPSASFIPEIWQGHKNRGEGFWLALDRLEGKL